MEKDLLKFYVYMDNSIKKMELKKRKGTYFRKVLQLILGLCLVCLLSNIFQRVSLIIHSYIGFPILTFSSAFLVLVGIYLYYRNERG